MLKTLSCLNLSILLILNLIIKTKYLNDYVEKREIDRSILNSLDRNVQLKLADVENLESLGKNAKIPSIFYWWLTFTLRRYMFILCVQENKFCKN